MKLDEYGEVINDEFNYEFIANTLKMGSNMTIGWTDGLGSHFDIFFAYRSSAAGNLQGGIRPTTDLVVSIMRRGSFMFEVGKESHYTYYGEKLNMGVGPTTEKMSELINNIRMLLK